MPLKQNIQVNKVAQLTGHNAAIYALAQGENNQTLLSGAGDGWIVRWGLANPEMGRLIAKTEDRVFSLLYLHESQKIVAGNMNGGVHWIDIENPENTKDISHHKKGVFGILRQGQSVFSIGGGGKLTRWDIESGRSLESIQLTNKSLRAIAFSSHRKEIAIGSSDYSIYFLDATTLAVKKKISQAHDKSVFSLRYSPDERFLLSGGRDAHLKVWDTDKNFDNIVSLPAHWYTIHTIAYHPEGKWFATGSRDKTIKIWDSSTFKLLKVIDTIKLGCHINSVNRLIWTPFHNYLISCSDDRSIIIWEVI